MSVCLCLCLSLSLCLCLSLSLSLSLSLLCLFSRVFFSFFLLFLVHDIPRRMFYVNDDPESKFLYTETIKLYCILFLFCPFFTSFLSQPPPPPPPTHPTSPLLPPFQAIRPSPSSPCRCDNKWDRLPPVSR